MVENDEVTVTIETESWDDPLGNQEAEIKYTFTVTKRRRGRRVLAEEDE